MALPLHIYIYMYIYISVDSHRLYIYICIYIYRVRPFHRLRFMSWFSPEIFRGIIDITLFDKRLSVDCGMLTVFFMYFSSIDSVWHTCSILFFLQMLHMSVVSRHVFELEISILPFLENVPTVWHFSFFILRYGVNSTLIVSHVHLYPYIHILLTKMKWKSEISIGILSPVQYVFTHM